MFVVMLPFTFLTDIFSEAVSHPHIPQEAAGCGLLCLLVVRWGQGCWLCCGLKSGGLRNALTIKY